MISVIGATNRRNSKTSELVDTFTILLGEKEQEHKSFCMQDLPMNFFEKNFYNGCENEELKKITENYLLKTQKLIIIAPEYNGSFPGVFKGFIDSVSPELFISKKIFLVGLSSGRGGNAIGLEHLTSVFVHLGSYVYPKRIIVSSIDTISFTDTFNPKLELGKRYSNILDGFLKW